MLALSSAALAAPAHAGLTITPSANAESLALQLIGTGIKLVPGSAPYAGASGASGFFSGDTTIFGNASGAKGVILTSGLATNALGPNNSTNKSTSNGLPGSAYLTSLVNAKTNDAATLGFKFTVDPSVNGIEWTYAFGSEEYNEYVNTALNDVFALVFDGTNLAIVPGTSLPIGINTLNRGNPFGSANSSNSQYYRNNSPGNSSGGVAGPFDTQYDGISTAIKAVASGLVPGKEYQVCLRLPTLRIPPLIVVFSFKPNLCFRQPLDPSPLPAFLLLSTCRAKSDAKSRPAFIEYFDPLRIGSGFEV